MGSTNVEMGCLPVSTSPDPELNGLVKVPKRWLRFGTCVKPLPSTYHYSDRPDIRLDIVKTASTI